MKATVNTSLLAKELKRVSQVINTNSVIPILSSVKMDFEKDKLTLTTTDLETTIVTTLSCDCPKSFVAIAEHKDLLDIFGKLSDQPVTLEKSGKKISIYGEGFKYHLPMTGNEEEFPKIPEEDFLFTIDADTEFFASLYSANSCVNPDDPRPTINTACLDFRKDGLTIVGTDAFRLYKKELPVKSGQKVQSLIRHKFIQAAKDIQAAKVSVGEKFLKLEEGGVSIITRLQDGKYIEYGMVLPQEVSYNLTANRMEFINSITKAAITSSKSTSMCVLNFSPNSIKITSQDIDFEKSGECDLVVNHSVEIDAIGVNSKQLLHMLNILDSDEVIICITSPTKSIYLKQPDDDTVFCLVQPLMIN